MWRSPKSIEKTSTATAVHLDNGDIYVLTHDGYLTARRPNGEQFVPLRSDVDAMVEALGLHICCMAELPNGWKLL